MNKIENYLIRTGLVRINPLQFIFLAITGCLSLFGIVFMITNSQSIGVSVCICLIAQAIETLNSRVQTQNQKANYDWPKFLDSIHSSAWAGATLEQAILDSRGYIPKSMEWAMNEFELDIESGGYLDVALDNLKARLAHPIADRFIEITRLANLSGGRGYLSALRAQALQLRIENSTWSEIQAKQTWVLGTAKLAVLAPWLVLVLLGMRPETAIAFQSELGLGVLVFGLVASLLAFKLIKVLGALPKRQRILGG